MTFVENGHVKLDDLRDYRAMRIFPSGHYELFRGTHPCMFAGRASARTEEDVKGEPITGIFQSENAGEDCYLYTSAQLSEDLSRGPSGDEYNPVGTALYPYITVDGTAEMKGPVMLVARAGRHFKEETVKHVLGKRTPVWRTQLMNSLVFYSPLLILAAAISAIFALGRLSAR